jgi:putative membrane protein insertion efficiency factor
VKFLAYFFSKLFFFWHRFVSPTLPAACRHIPTCSEYGAEALRRHGLIRGLGLTLHRVARCHPWGSAGYDPVPSKPEESLA